MAQTKKASDWMRKKEYKQLKKDMLNDLESRGLIAKQYVDKVEEYMRLWCWLQMLNEDIMERGVYIEYQNGSAQKGTTDNKSLGIAARISGQMLNIWSALGFREQAVNAKAVAPDEDEL